MTLIGSEGTGLGSILTADDIGNDGSGGAKYLSTIYLAGLAHNPATDNLFPMATGNMRWWGDTGTGQFPNAAFFESDTTPGDPRVAAWYTQRFYDVGVGIGDIAGDALVGFDSTWGGTFGELNDLTLTTERVGFSKSTDQAGYPSGPDFLLLGSASWLNNSGFFDGPLTQPTPGSNAGGRTLWQVSLYNSHDANIDVRGGINGWGQWFGKPQAIANGITAAADFQANLSSITVAADDGIGIFFRRAADDPAKAIVDAHTLTTDPHGNWGLGFWASGGTDPSGITRIATMDWTNGIVFNAPVSTVSNGLSVVAQTGLIDLTTVADNIPISVPQRSGFYFCPFAARVFFRDAAGAATAGTLTISYGNNATHDNGGSSALTAANWNTMVTQQPAYIALGAGSTMAPELIDASAQFFTKISAVPTGVTSGHGRVVVIGFWVPV